MQVVTLFFILLFFFQGKMSLWKYHISFKIEYTLTPNLKHILKEGIGSVYISLHGVKLMEAEDLKNTSCMSEASPIATSGVRMREIQSD